MPLTLSTLLLSAALAGGCGSSSSVSVDDAGTTPPDAVATTTGTIVHGTSQPCTEPHTICMTVTFPADMTVQPNKIAVDLYAAVPPTHPPDGVPLAITTPNIQAGETVQLRMTDAGLTGSYNFWGLVFMPTGGDPFPVKGVDYIANSTAAYPLTGEAFNLPETLDFHQL